MKDYLVKMVATTAQSKVYTGPHHINHARQLLELFGALLLWTTPTTGNRAKPADPRLWGPFALMCAAELFLLCLRLARVQRRPARLHYLAPR